MGLSPEAIAQAAADEEVTPGDQDFTTKLFGGPSHLQRSQEVDGRLTAATRPAAVQRIRDITGLVGHISTVDESLEFMSSSNVNGAGLGVHISVLPVGERSRLTIKTEVTHAYASYLFLMFPVVPMLVAIGKAHGQIWDATHLPIVTLLAVGALIAFITARQIVMRAVKKAHRITDELVQALTADMEQTPELNERLASLPSHEGPRVAEVESNRASQA